MKALLSLLLLLSGFTSSRDHPKLISIQWVDKLSGDFSFAKKQTIYCEAWCYEWAGTRSITAIRKTRDTVHCYAAMNVATHCSLDLIIVKDSCLPTVVLKSIVAHRDKIYPYQTGYIKIDKLLWRKNILKAEFDMVFVNDENDRKVFWKGRIYTKVKSWNAAKRLLE